MWTVTPPPARSRRDTYRLVVLGVLLASLYALVAWSTSVLSDGAVRPLYEGPCPPTQCPICPPQPCPTYPPYRTEPPSPKPSKTRIPSNSPSAGPTGARTSRPTHTPAPSASVQVQPSATVAPTPRPTSSLSSSLAPPEHNFVIGPEGGTVTSNDGALTLVIPAGALGTPSEIRLTALAAGPPAPPGQRLLGTTWQLSVRSVATVTTPSAPVTTFAVDVELLLSYETTPPDHLAQWDGSKWAPLSTTVLRDVHQAVARVRQPGLLGAFSLGITRKSTLPMLPVVIAVVLLLIAAGSGIQTSRRRARSQP